MNRKTSQKKKQVNIENSTVEDKLNVEALKVEINKASLEKDNSQESVGNNTLQNDSKKIYKESFDGKIYTFYSLNLRYLFTSKEEEELEEKLLQNLDRKKEIFSNLPNDLDEIKKTDNRITEIKAKLIELRRKANMFLVSREYNYFVKHLDVFKSLKKMEVSEEIAAYCKNRKDKENKEASFFFTKTEENRDPRFFIIEDASEELEKELKVGIQLSIFRHNLTEHWLEGKYFKVYEINKEESGEYAEKTSTSFYVRLSRLGVLEIRKEETFSIEQCGDHTLKEEMKTLIGYEGKDSFRKKEVAQITVEFCKSIAKQIQESYKLSKYFKEGRGKKKEAKNIKAKDLLNSPKPNLDIDLTSLDRQRYVVIVINELSNTKGEDAHKYLSQQAPAILEGRFLQRDPKNPEVEFPEVIDKMNRLKDFSTWADELFFASAERALIHFKNKKGYYLIGNDPVAYEEYWQSVIRGIEFSCLIRMALRIIEITSRKLVHHIPKHLIEVDEIELDTKKFNEFKEEVHLLQNELAHFLKIVPELRSASNAVNSFRSGRNVRKFNYLQDKCFGFEEILGNIQKNTDDLTYFVNSFKQRVLQKTIEDENSRQLEKDNRLNILALTLTVIAVIYIFPSFVNDYKDLTELHLTVSKGVSVQHGLAILFGIIALAAIIFIKTYKFFKGRKKSNH